MVCDTCARRKPNGVCGISNQTIEEHYKECPFAVDEILTCGFCGTSILPARSVILLTEPPQIICWNCERQLGRCTACSYMASCGVRNYKGPLPLHVMQTFQNGNMTVQQQVINPQIINSICPSCGCGNIENCRTGEGCEKYKCIFGEDI